MGDIAIVLLCEAVITTLLIVIVLVLKLRRKE